MANVRVRRDILPAPGLRASPIMPSNPAAAREISDATASFYDATARRYDADVDGQLANQTLRTAFRKCVSTTTSAGSLILDFGCGTGLDAAWYASRGHKVIAYDVSCGMVGVLRERCATEIAEGRITPIAGGLELLVEELERSGPVAVIAANFAVLNHVRDLHPLIAALSPHLAEDGVIVASVLNPFYVRDMMRAWWWRGLPASIWTGAIKVVGEVTTYRHFMHRVRTMASPHFEHVTRLSPFDATKNARAATDASIRETLGENYLFILLRRSA